MKKLAAVVILMGLAGAAFAQAPQVTAPRDGDRVGPSVDVIGKTEGRQFVVIITDVHVKGQTEPVGSVPGHRHWTDSEGNFKLRIATPRVRNAPDSDITYMIRVFTQRPGERPGPETVITCTPR